MRFSTPSACRPRRVVLALARSSVSRSPGRPRATNRVRTRRRASARRPRRRATAVLDRFSLATVTIDPEARVSVQSRCRADLRSSKAGTRVFLVKVINQADVTAPLRVSSPQSGRVSIPAWSNEIRPGTHDQRQRTSRSAGRNLALRQAADCEALRPPARVPDSRDLQPRPRPARRRAEVRRRTGNGRSRLSVDLPVTSRPPRHGASRCGLKTRPGARRSRD